MTDGALSVTDGDLALMWMREHGWRQARYQRALEVLVSTRAYTGRVAADWCPLLGVKQGDASPYPVVASIPPARHHAGQWKLQEVLAVREAIPGLVPWREGVAP